MTLRKTDLDRVDQELRTALSRVEEIRAAEHRLADLKLQIGELVLEVRAVEEAEQAAARALAKLEGVSLLSLYDSLLGTSQDRQEVEWVALRRAQQERLEATRRLERLEQEARATQALLRSRPAAQQAVSQALDAKAVWLCRDEGIRQRFVELATESQRLHRLIAELDRELAMQKTHDPPPLQPFHVQLVRERRRQAAARARDLERERLALLLDGVSTRG